MNFSTCFEFSTLTVARLSVNFNCVNLSYQLSLGMVHTAEFLGRLLDSSQLSGWLLKKSKQIIRPCVAFSEHSGLGLLQSEIGVFIMLDCLDPILQCVRYVVTTSEYGAC